LESVWCDPEGGTLTAEFCDGKGNTIDGDRSFVYAVFVDLWRK